MILGTKKAQGISIKIIKNMRMREDTIFEKKQTRHEMAKNTK